MAAPDELQQLLALSRDRVAYQNPLFQAVTQMAYSGLPIYARQGTQLSGSLPNAIPAIAPRSGGMSPATAGLLGGLGGAALNSLGPNGNALKALIDGIKKLFSHQQGIQGNKPFGGGITPSANPYNPNDLFLGWPNQPGSARGLTPNVTTSEIYGFPSFPTFPPSMNGYPSDPSAGSGVGPGMQGFRTQFPVLADPSEE